MRYIWNKCLIVLFRGLQIKIWLTPKSTNVLIDLFIRLSCGRYVVMNECFVDTHESLQWPLHGDHRDLYSSIMKYLTPCYPKDTRMSQLDMIECPIVSKRRNSMAHITSHPTCLSASALTSSPFILCLNIFFVSASFRVLLFTCFNGWIPSSILQVCG